MKLPYKCLRKRKDCQPLSQIIADENNDFICCGLNDPESRSIPQDNFCFCWKNNSYDDRSDWDERDIKDTIHVLSEALSVEANIRLNKQDENDKSIKSNTMRLS